jgi:hypothetical protein
VVSRYNKSGQAGTSVARPEYQTSLDWSSLASKMVSLAPQAHITKGAEDVRGIFCRSVMIVVWRYETFILFVAGNNKFKLPTTELGSLGAFSSTNNRCINWKTLTVSGDH